MKLSIITINYNNKNGFQKTIDSVIAQTWRDFEWIVIDGGSTDGSKELIEKYQEHFAYWCSEPDKGVYNAMNKGIAKAKGEYLNFMNSGDCVNDQQTFDKVFSHELTSDLVYGDWIQMYNNYEEYVKAPDKGFNATVYIENVCHQSMFIRSSILKEKGYDENMNILADWKRCVEMSLAGNTFQYIPIAVSKVEAEFGISRQTTPRVYEEYNLILEEMPQIIRRYKEKRDEAFSKVRFYENNHLVSEVTKIVLEGPSYKTKLIHLNLIVLRLLEKICGFF